MKLVKEKILPLIITALNEDIGSGDITTALVFEKDDIVQARLIAKEDCIVAGIDIARWIFDILDEKIGFMPLCKDGDRIKKGKKVINIKGSVRNILAGERTALNFLGKLSGIATLTGKFTAKIKGTNAKILDTRKTTPGARILEKYAVRVGGGHNHRMGLWDGVLIKDNHIGGSMRQTSNPRLEVIKNLVEKAKKKGYKAIEIEVDDLSGFKAALEAGVHIIMLDNMRLEDIKQAVKMKRPKVLLEVSGNVSLENIQSIAKAGVDRISIGLLTHSAPSIDFSLEISG